MHLKFDINEFIQILHIYMFYKYDYIYNWMCKYVSVEF